MHEQLEKTIKSNLQITINRLHAKRDLVSNSTTPSITFLLVLLYQETKNRFAKYSNQLNEIKHRLQSDIYGHDYVRTREHTASTHRSTIAASTSLAAIPHRHHHQSESTSSILTSSSNILSSGQSSRRQTINSNSPIVSQPADDELASYINQTTESTRF